LQNRKVELVPQPGADFGNRIIDFWHPACTHDEGVLTGFNRTDHDIITGSFSAEPKFECFASEQLIFAVEDRDRRQRAKRCSRPAPVR
jgi:hypothetical protein